MLVPVFRTIYAPVKQLILAFSPDNESGFKRVVLVERSGPRQPAGLPDPRVHGRPPPHGRPRNWWPVYVPTNHLYLGDVLIVPPDRSRSPTLTVEQGIRVFLTGGMALPGSVPVGDPPTADLPSKTDRLSRSRGEQPGGELC